MTRQRKVSGKAVPVPKDQVRGAIAAVRSPGRAEYLKISGSYEPAAFGPRSDYATGAFNVPACEDSGCAWAWRLKERSEHHADSMIMTHERFPHAIAETMANP